MQEMRTTLSKKKNIKAAFFDIDGTLFSHRTLCVPESTLRALRCLAERGILCVIATGRHISELAELDFLNYGFDAYITLNGQLCLNNKLEIVYGTPMKGESLEGMLRFFIGGEIPSILISKDRMYINYINDDVRRAHHDIHTNIPVIGEYAGEPIYMGVIYCTKEKEREASVIENLPGCNITRWSRHGIDIVPSGGDKAARIRRYLDIMGLSREETIAFGDGENDIKMLKFAGIGIALGNAEEAVKAEADYVTADIDDNGVYKALKYFGII